MHLPVEIGLDGSVNYGLSHSGHDHGEHEDHDGHDDHDDHEGHEEHDEHNEGEKDSKWSVHPSIIFGGDKIERVLSKHKVNKPRDSKTLVRADDAKGYIVINNTKITAGLGLDLDYHLPTEGSLIGIGLSANRGTKKYSEQHISSLSDKSSLISLKAPRSIEDLSKWSTGDRLTFGVTGGLTFMSHFGLEPFFHAGPLFHAGGSWVVKIKKTDETSIDLRISKSKIRALAIEVDSIFISAELEKFKGQDKFFSFNFDLGNVEAQVALAKLYEGDLKYAQKLMEVENSGIERLLKGYSLSSGSSKVSNFSFPFLFGASKAKSKIMSYSEEENFFEESVTKIYSSTSSIEKTTRGVLSNHKMALNNFYASYANEWHIDHPHVAFGGTYKWMYEKDKVKAKTILKKLEKLSKIIGKHSALEMKFDQKDLGYFRVEFDTQISNKDTLQVMGLPGDDQTIVYNLFSNINTNADKYIAKHFNNYDHSELCPILRKMACFRKVHKKTKKAIYEMQSMAFKMRKLFIKKDYKDWANAYVKWGSLLTSNQFVFQSVIKALKNTKMKLSVMGESYADQYFELEL
jgi:hypothetical protein